MNPKKDFNLLGNINKGYTKMPEDTLYLPITEDDAYTLQEVLIGQIDHARACLFQEKREALVRVNVALQHSLAAAQEKGQQ